VAIALNTGTKQGVKWLKNVEHGEHLYTSPPAQQEPKIDIYRSFEQWKSGNVLEHGVPRTEHYSEAQLDLVEMGWNYGYDAGRAVEQALDKKAENARELGLDYEPAKQGPVAEYIGECSDGSLVQLYDDVKKGTKFYTSPPAQRTWVGLTDEEIARVVSLAGFAPDWVEAHIAIQIVRVLEAKLKEKNNG
jgi:hypothetical protein